jgi:hypothetical protein
MEYRIFVLISVQHDEMRNCIPDLEKTMHVHNEMIADSSNSRSFVGGSDARIVLGATKPLSSAFGTKTAVKSSWRTFRAG